MKIDQVYTPAILLNLDYMEHNLKKYAASVYAGYFVEFGLYGT